MKRLLTTIVAVIFLCFFANSQASFLDIGQEAGINNTGRNYGVATGDFDNDGLEDIYVSRTIGKNILYKKKADGTYIDVAADAGVDHDGTTYMSIWGDIDNDGDLDLYLGNRDEPNMLYLNKGDGTFDEIGSQAYVAEQFPTRAVLFADVENDGDLDLYVANINSQNSLYRNNGNLTFTNITYLAGVPDVFTVAMGAMFFDYDNDGDQDLYLTHDANQPNILYRNNGDLNFTNVSEESNTNYAGNGMGVDFGDVNNDGFPDIYITNLDSNTLLLNNTDGTFTDITQSAGVGDVAMGWGVTWLDYDNDGWQDIYLANDSYFAPFPNILYRNNGDNTFEIVSEGTVMESMFGGYGISCSDVNDDGWLDIFLANSGEDGNQFFLNNNQNGNAWVKVKLNGTISNRSAIGARVEVRVGDVIHIDEVMGGSGYASQNSMVLHFGLGQVGLIDELIVKWPSGLEEVFEDLEVNATYELIEDQGTVTDVEELLITGNWQVYPNPISEVIHCRLDLKENEFVRISLFTVQGQLLQDLHRGPLPYGHHQFSWENNFPEGLLLLRLQVGDEIYSRKIISTKN